MTGKWSGMQFQVDDMNDIYWTYDFINPRRPDRLIKAKKNGRVCTNIDDQLEKNYMILLLKSFLNYKG